MGKGHQKGFTIVELLIVIVVIAILATISIVAYNDIQARANRNVRIQDHVRLKKSFEAYKATYGYFPPAATGGYCIGEGFEDATGDSVGNCRNTVSSDTRHSYNASITQELAKVAPYVPSKPTRANPSNVHVGPYVYYYANELHVHNFYNGTGSCPDGTTKWWTDSTNGGTYACQFVLSRQ